ncbi:uncharacterized protein LOC122250307 [Penaeus japonicus]|uniref:uncharacterized protein LOC122250307 n=1 Tax=Penaeus japonicus TaxID=27405 RepID=UPI001C70B701|nr:uncharacterized protein LOC122250307 [Penaeus japonicus]XP_042867601.1 uncharacterized protein LOC122250307 [Penaeus japonicus]
MAWRSPASLSQWAARAVVAAVVKETEQRLRLCLALVPAELLIARATAGLLLRNTDSEDSEDDDDEEEEEEEEEEGGEEGHGKAVHGDVMDHALRLAKGHVLRVARWWRKLPGQRAAPGHTLRDTLDGLTEVNPKYDQDFPTHLTRLLLKLVLLDAVFVDRDYGDKDRRCVVPFAWERWFARLVARLGPFTHLQELQVYGGMYPSILAAILKGAPFLTSLLISHINITDEILLVASRFCPRLERLYLLHNFPWQVISLKAFCAAFFDGASKRDLVRVMRAGCEGNVRRTFNSLQEVDLAYGEIEVAKEFHRFLLSFYPDLTSISCEWKTNVFEDGYSSHGYDVLFPIISKGQQVSLKRVYLDGVTLYSAGRARLQQMAWSCPAVTSLSLDCSTRGSPSVYETAGKQLTELLSEWTHFSELHANVSCEDHVTHTMLTPALRVHGGRLTSLTLEASCPGQRLHAATVCLLVHLCPALTSLRLRVWNRSMLEAPASDTPSSTPLELHCANLEEFCLHEDGPGDQDDPVAEEGHLARWTGLLEAVMAASPLLATLSISICRGVAPLMDKLQSDILVLHLHVKDGYEWEPSVEQLCQLVSRLPRLQHLFLEEVSGRLFWRVRRRYQYTGLRVHWGNLYGWPRT